MAGSENTGSGRHRAESSECGVAEALLRSEIEFWRALIESQPYPQQTASLERMGQALALAESKLASLHDMHREALEPVQGCSNIYRLDGVRRTSR